MPESPSLGSSLLSLLWVFLCVVVVVGLAYWFTKHVVSKGFGGSLFSQGENGAVKVLARTSLGKDQQLLLAEAMERYFLLGVTAAGITNLAEFTPEEAQSWKERYKPPEQGQQLPSFKEALHTVLKHKGKR